jgi:hypothetical protein
MTEVNGLHLAFRGLIAGLAAGWVWVAVALTGLVLAGTDPLAATTHLGNGTAGSGLISALAIAQVGAGGIGLVFAYFFGRYFTVRGTLAVAALAFAVLGWLATAYVLDGSWLSITRQAILTLAAVAYGAMLGGAVPTRTEVLRGPPSQPVGSPST